MCVPFLTHENFDTITRPLVFKLALAMGVFDNNHRRFTSVYMYIYNYQAIAMGKNALAWLLNSHTLATCLRLLMSCMLHLVSCL